MDQNHNPRHIFPPLSSFLCLFGHSHRTPGPQVALVLCPIAFVSSISVEQAQGTRGSPAPLLLSPRQSTFLQILTSLARSPEGFTSLQSGS